MLSLRLQEKRDMKKTQWPVLFPHEAAHLYPVLRAFTVTILALILVTPLLAVCGCHDVKGAASGTAGQMGERQQRSKDATDILDSGTSK
jgi:hypothetical protein